MTSAAPSRKRRFPAREAGFLAQTTPSSLTEVIDGVPVPSPVPTPRHQEVVMMLGVAFFRFVYKNDRGTVLPAPLDVRFSETDVLHPDLLFIAKERRAIIGDTGIEGVPDLVVEVLAPETAYYDLKQKKRLYEAGGVKEYWLVDPMERSIELYLNGSGQFALTSRAEATGAVTSKLLAGFTIELKAIF